MQALMRACEPRFCETRLESIDEPEEGFQRTRWGRRGGMHACVGEPGPTRAAICA